MRRIIPVVLSCVAAIVTLSSSRSALALPPPPPPVHHKLSPPPPPPAPKVRRPPPAPEPRRDPAAMVVRRELPAQSPGSAAERVALRGDRKTGGALIAGAVASFGASVSLQALALTNVERRCIAPAERGVSECVADDPGIVGAGAAGALFAVTGVGLAAGAGWELGAGRRPRRALQVLGAMAVGLGLSAVIGSRVARVAGTACEDGACESSQRLTDFAVRNVGALLVASGAASLTAYARARRVSVAPTRYAGGMGLTLTVRW
jgi:hypothetical protein